MNPSPDAGGGRIADEAIDWFIRTREGDLTAADRKCFDQWLAESPVHVREYLRITDLWGGLHVQEQWPAETSAQLLAAIRNASEMSVARLPQETGGKPSRPSLRQRFLFALAAGLLCVAAGITWHLAVRSPAYVTTRGEQRSVVLPDGSIVQLNTLSRLNVRFDEHRRRVELASGEAFFRVASNPARPFEVVTPFAHVRALGTEFNVYNQADRTRVAVLEGKVRLGPAEAAQRTLDLNPQQAADVVADGGIKRVPASPSRPLVQTATAWIQRRIILDNDRIDTALDEFNRYNALQVRIENAALGKLRISGGFSADDPGALVKYLERVHGVRAEQAGENLLILR
jgi:transmembrane sensor